MTDEIIKKAQAAYKLAPRSDQELLENIFGIETFNFNFGNYIFIKPN